MAILEWNKNPHQKKQYEYDIQSADDMIHFFARNTISMLFHGLQFIYQGSNQTTKGQVTPETLKQSLLETVSYLVEEACTIIPTIVPIAANSSPFRKISRVDAI